jgi:cobalt-zinc-cadmium efflux system protein
MGCSHHLGAPSYRRIFALGVLLNLAFAAAEATFGVLAGSLALIADAGHNASDVFTLLLAWAASVLAGVKPSTRRTYGLRRTTILAALLSAVALCMALGVIAWEAIARLSEPSLVSGPTMITVAGLGVVINGATAFLLKSARKRDLNVRGAYLHMLADAGVSLGVVITGLAIMVTGRSWLDPAISLVIVAIILVSGWEFMRDSLNMAVDAVPKGIDPLQVIGYLANLPGVEEVHDLHIWGMSTTETALTAHLVMPYRPANDGFLHGVANHLQHRFGIGHATIQIECGDAEHPCGQADAEGL